MLWRARGLHVCSASSYIIIIIIIKQCILPIFPSVYITTHKFVNVARYEYCIKLNRVIGSDRTVNKV